MFIPFNDLPDTSRVWIYQANRSFTESEIEEISLRLEQFISSWIEHCANLNASIEIKYKRFIIITLDQNMNVATGCSIDTSVHFIPQLEKDSNADLLDKMTVSYK